MKNYLRYACTVCERTIDKLVDRSRFIPDKCNITLNCQGRLVPVEYKGSAEINPAPKTNIVDWYPRGTTFSIAEISNEELVSAYTGAANQLVLAVALPAPPPPGAQVTLTLTARSSAPKTYRQYVFRKDAQFSTISGVEAGPAKKALRYSVTGPDPDLVEVFVDGVRYEEGTGPNNFQLNDGSLTPAVPPNTVSFNSPIPVSGNTQVDVIVSKLVPLETELLVFSLNEGGPTRPSGAWENIRQIERLGTTYFLFTHDLSTSSGLTENSILFPGEELTASFQPIPIPLSSCQLLLARKPFTQVDRYPDIVVSLSALDGQGDYLKYHKVDGAMELDVTKQTLTQLYPPGKLVKIAVEETLKEPPGFNDEQLVVDGSVVVGPDV